MTRVQCCPHGHPLSDQPASDATAVDLSANCPLCQSQVPPSPSYLMDVTLAPVQTGTVPSAAGPLEEDATVVTPTLLGTAGTGEPAPNPRNQLRLADTLVPSSADLSQRPSAADHSGPPVAATRVAGPPGQAAPLPRRFAGYEILGELGRGAMGVVYKARQLGLNRVCALKMILGGEHAGTEAQVRFRVEAEAIAHLQHPNIVQVYEIGTEAGRPYFSLEYIDGIGLDRRIGGQPQPPREAARLAEQICEGVHAAHQRGILHRDLKPANILLTTEGTPKITDFGLAKRLEEEDQGQTRTGTVMGTPSYMAPEQASGRSRHLGPAADVFALGAILYDLLTGRPPFRGETALDTLQQVQTLEPLPPGRLVPKVPADLQTICLKALAKVPGRRYATAGDMADDLRRYLAGEHIHARPISWAERTVKWIKRRPALATLIGVSCLAVVGILTFGGLWLNAERQAAQEREHQQTAAAEMERQRRQEAELLRAAAVAQKVEADIQRQHAEDNFNQARRAVDEMLTRVGGLELAHEPHMEQVRLKLLEKALQFYQDFLAARADDPVVRFEAGVAHQRVGDIARLLGKYEDAEKHYREALKRFAELLAHGKQQADVLEARAGTTNNLGLVLQDQSRLGEAQKQLVEAVALWRQLCQAQPHSAVAARHLARSLGNLGTVYLARQQPAQAVDLFREGNGLVEEWAKDRARADFALDLAGGRINLGSALADLHRHEEAADAYAAARVVLEGLAAHDPHAPEYRQRLAVCLKLTADLVRDTRPAEAGDAYRASLQLRETLARDYPTAPLYRQELADSWINLGLFLQATAAGDEADKAYLQGLQIQEKVVAEFPRPDFRKNLASACVNRAVFLLTQQRLAEGEALLLKAASLCRELVKDHADVAAYREEQASVTGNLATLYLLKNSPEEAQAAFGQALEIRVELAQRFAELPAHQFKLAQLQANYGALLVQLRKDDSAVKALLAARAGLALLAQAYPAVPDYAFELAACDVNLALVYRKTGQFAQAEEPLAAGLALYRKLAQDQPKVTEYRKGLGRALYEQGILQGSRSKADFPAAVVSLSEAIAIQKQLANQQPQQSALQVQLAQSHLDLGIASLHAKKTKDGQRAYEEGIRLLEALQPSPDTMPQACRLLAVGHLNYASLMAALKQPQLAEKSWQRALELQEGLARAHPQVAEYHVSLAQTHVKLAGRFLKADQLAQARDHAQQALASYRTATELSPTDADVRQQHYDTHLTLASLQLGLEDHAAAKTLGSAVGLLGQSAPAQPRHFLVAELFGKCMVLARQDKALERQYGEQTLAALRRAVDGGYKDAVSLKTSPAFELLRAWPQFQQLVTEVEKLAK
jgi:tetratricopeptide (TPR) repeat protein